MRRLVSLTLWNQMERVNAEVLVRRVRLAELEKRRAQLDLRGQAALAASVALLEAAEEAAAQNNGQGAWYALHDIDEELVWTLSRDEALLLAVEVREKFGATPSAGAAGKAVAQILGDLAKKKELVKMTDEEVRARVCKACEIRHQHWEFKYHGTGMLVGRVALLTLALSLALAVLLVVAGTKLSPLPKPLDRPLFFLDVFLFGAVGGTLSAILSATGGDKVLPESAREAPWHLARPLFGAAAGVILAIVLAAGGFGLKADNDAAYLAFATAGGFTEGLLVKMMGNVASKAEGEKKG
jgi:hypothetical protein